MKHGQSKKEERRQNKEERKKKEEGSRERREPAEQGPALYTPTSRSPAPAEIMLIIITRVKMYVCFGFSLARLRRARTIDLQCQSLSLRSSG